MGRKPRAPKPQIEGTWPVESGVCRIVSDPRRDGAYVIFLDQVPSSTIALDAPRVLGFEYMEWIARLLRTQDYSTAHMLHLGGAAASLARYAVDVWPQSHHTVVEVDGLLIDVIRNVFGIPAGVDYVHAEARTVTHALEEHEADVIIRDVFAGGHTPEHLMTVEYFEACHRSLTPGGLYIANCGDKEGLPTVRDEIEGLREVFQHVAAMGPDDMIAGRAYGNIVLVASDNPLPEGAMLRSIAHLTGNARRD